MPQPATRTAHGWKAVTALGAVLLANGSTCDAQARASEMAANVAAPSRLEITFKLDERLTRGLYMGDRWVSPPTYTANLAAGAAVVDARADVVDPGGRRSPAAARWVTSDPSVAVVSPDEGSAVRISFLRDGEASLSVTTGGVSRDLTVKATRKEAALLVEIRQPAASPPATASTPSAATPVSKERAGYAVGLYLGRRLREQRWHVDAEALSRGLADALSATGTTEMTDAEVGAVLTELRARDGARSAGARH